MERITTMDPFSLIPEHLRLRLFDSMVGGAARAIEAIGGRDAARKLRRLRSDTPLKEFFAAALNRALQRFLAEWEAIDPELTGRILSDLDLWRSPLLATAMEAIVTAPGAHRTDEYNTIVDQVLQRAGGEIDRLRVERAVQHLLKCITDEVWAHPQFQPVYSLMMQRASAEATLQLLHEIRGLRQDNSSLLQAISAEPATIPAIQQSSTVELSASPSVDASNSTASRPETPPHQPSPSLSKPTTQQLMELPDLLTPEIRGTNIYDSHVGLVGVENANILSAIHKRAIRSVEGADFEEQVSIGRDLMDLSLELPDFSSTAHYIIGEGERLKADLAVSDEERVRLMSVAEEEYATSLEYDGRNARAMRGLARTWESQGKVGPALTLFEKARAIVMHDLLSSTDGPSNGTLHEALRVTRHYAACIVDARESASANTWNRQTRALQLHGIALESQELHQRYMPQLAASTHWGNIEWFMGLVLLAKAYQSVGDSQRAWFALLHALSARRSMLHPGRQMSAVEHGNITWWCKTASRLDPAPSGFLALVEELEDANRSNTSDIVLRVSDEIVLPIRPPWVVTPGSEQ